MTQSLQPTSKHPAELKKPFAMSAVSDASSKNQRPYGSLSQNADGDVVGELTGAGKAVHLAKLVGAYGVDLLSG